MTKKITTPKNVKASVAIPTPMPRFNAKITPKQQAMIKKIAKAEKISEGQVIRNILDHYRTFLKTK